MHKLKEKLKEQLYEYEDRIKKMPSARMSSSDIQAVHMLSDTVKNLCKISMYEEAEEGESNASYEAEASYRRGRMRARRDSMGRYSREGGYSEDGYAEERGSSNRGGSYGGSYGGNSYGGSKEEMLEKIEQMKKEIERM